MSNINSIGFILDGNRRYGQKKNISFSSAYNKGAEKALEIIYHISKNHKNIKQIHLFTLSKENVENRSKTEIKQLYSLFKKNEEKIKNLNKKNICFKFVGNFKKLSSDFRKSILKYNKDFKEKKLCVFFYVGYGGRQEIIDAVNKIKLKKINISETNFKKYLYDKEIIDPNVIVRTGDAKRLSGFMLYHAAYSELVFLKKFWPEITTKDVNKIINDYNKVKVNYGA
jgi:undecaprenyl diphosphate synthase